MSESCYKHEKDLLNEINNKQGEILKEIQKSNAPEKQHLKSQWDRFCKIVFPIFFGVVGLLLPSHHSGDMFLSK